MSANTRRQPTSDSNPSALTFDADGRLAHPGRPSAPLSTNALRPQLTAPVGPHRDVAATRQPRTIRSRLVHTRWSTT